MIVFKKHAEHVLLVLFLVFLVLLPTALLVLVGRIIGAN